jgi:hypothetical protein
MTVASWGAAKGDTCLLIAVLEDAVGHRQQVEPLGQKPVHDFQLVFSLVWVGDVTEAHRAELPCDGLPVAPRRRAVDEVGCARAGLWLRRADAAGRAGLQCAL